jgi:serine/threonine protein kinase
MPDEPTVDAPHDGPAPSLVRVAVDRYLSAWESARDAGSRPTAEEVLSALPERDRPALREFVTAFDALVQTTAHRHAAKPDTVDGRPERTVAYTVDGTAIDPSVTGDFSPSAPAAGARTPQPLQPVQGYEILDELGRGGMGVVYKARQTRLRRVVALKLMLQADYAGKTARERFDAEAQAVARMQHPNIVQVFEVGEVDGKPFFSLEFVDGGTLSDKVAKNLLRPKEAATMMVTLARAIHYAHEHGIVHRDLKPGNVLLTDDGTPKIADFGLAKKLEEDSGLTRMGTIVGTPSFMPPEQAAGEIDRVGKSADIYSLGAILYDLLTGRPPFKGANVIETLSLVRSQEPLAPSSLQPGVPRDLETICLKCLQKDPARRYTTAAELADDLDRYLRGEPILARPISNVERAWRWCRRNQRVAGLLGTVAVLLILITAGSTTAAVIINKSRNQISEQKDTIADQLEVITVKEKLAADRLEAYRQGVDAFVNEAPSILEGYPMARAPAEEMLQLTIKLLEDAQGKADDAGLTDRGRLSVLLRQSELLAKAQSKSADAARLLAESRVLAERLAAPGQPERDKGAGNLALVINLQAADARAARKFSEAIKLHEHALALQKRVLDRPESGEISAEEARTWIANTQFNLGATRHLLAQTMTDLEAAQRELNQARKDLKAAQQILSSTTPPANPRQAERLQNRIGITALEYARVCEKLGDLNAADAAFDEVVACYQKLFKVAPQNLMYRQNLSVAAAEYGDLLLIKRKDAVKAQQMYTFAVSHLLPIARPPDLDDAVGTLALNYYREATAARATKDEANAKKLYGLCVEIRETQLRAAERRALSEKQNYPTYLQSARINLMLAQARYGQHKEAAAIANEIVQRAQTAFAQASLQMVNRCFRGAYADCAVPIAQLGRELPRLGVRQAIAASGFSLCAAVPNLEPKERAKYLERAFECLNRAIDFGYRDRETIEQDPDFEPLRKDPRFADVVKRLEAGKRP